MQQHQMALPLGSSTYMPHQQVKIMADARCRQGVEPVPLDCG